MSTRTDLRPANAGAITRLLVKAGLEKGETHSTAVRGWHHFYEGVTATQDGNRRYYTPTLSRGRRGRTQVTLETNGWVYVDYQLGQWDRREAGERGAHISAKLTRAADVLRAKGYHVEPVLNERTKATERLHVCRKNEAGEVVKF